MGIRLQFNRLILGSIIIIITIMLMLSTHFVLSIYAAPNETGPGENQVNDPSQTDFNVSSEFPDITDNKTEPVNVNTEALSATSAILIETARGQVLFEKAATVQYNIPVANKIMTALLTIEAGNLNDIVTISKLSSESAGSILFLEAGGRYTLEELVYAIILGSFNDAANALAEHTGGSLDSFVDMMNKKALELGMLNTRFTNPTGLFDEFQYTTAQDLSILVKNALGNATFNRIFAYQARPVSTNKGVKILTNSNKLFWSYTGIDGGKTGYNEKNRQTAITAATRNGMRIISVVMEAPEETLFQDAQLLLDYGFYYYRRGTLLAANEPIRRMEVDGNEFNLVSINDIFYTFPSGNNYIESLDFLLPEKMDLPIKKSVSAGKAIYTLNDGTIIDVNLYPDRDIATPDDFITRMLKKFSENRDILILLGFLAFIEVIIIFCKIIKLLIRIVRKFTDK